MINIVTGSIHSGKTETLRSIYHSLKSGDGVLSLKVMVDGDIYGYDAYFISKDESIPYMIHKNHYHNQFETTGSIGPYFFDRAVMDRIQKHVTMAIETGVMPIFIDEVGRLELSGDGFDKIVKDIVNKDIEAYITINENLLDEVRSSYGFNNFRIKEHLESLHV